MLSKEYPWNLEHSVCKGRPAKELKVSMADRAQLESIARSQSLPASIVATCADYLAVGRWGERHRGCASLPGESPDGVDVAHAIREHGSAGLHNEIKPGRPRSTGEDQIAKLVNTALRPSPKRQDALVASRPGR